VLNFIAEMALKVEEMFPEYKIHVLAQNQQGTRTYTSSQAACLVAHGFFCLIPEQDPDLDMPPLPNFTTWHFVLSDMYVEKLKFYLEYFRALMTEEVVGKVSITFKPNICYK
jgi:hypothetical protein